MDGISQEANTQLVNEFNSQFFFNLPTDLRYQLVEFVKYSPQSALSSHGDIRFYLPPRTGAAVYFLKDIFIEARVNLQNEDGTKIADGKDVSVVNNTPHSLLKRLSIKIGDVSIVNTDNDFYYYKAYLKNLLSNSSSVKGAQIGKGADNFVIDTPKFFDANDSTNVGYFARAQSFRHSVPDGATTKLSYYGDDVTYIARLQHDLVSCDVPLIPGIEVNIEMSLNKKEFVVKTNDTGANYNLKVKELYLHVPIGILSASLYNSMEATLKNTPVLMHYTRTSVSILEIPTDSLNFTAETIFSRTQVPSKIIIGFVDTEAFNGSYKKNGFNFRRSWTGASSVSQVQHPPSTTTPPQRERQRDEESDIEILNAERRLNELRSELTNITSTSNQRRNSIPSQIQRFLGISRNNDAQINITNLAERIQELEDLLENIRVRRVNAEPIGPVNPLVPANETTPENPTDNNTSSVTAETITNFIKGTLLTFNGHPIDSLTQLSASEREDAINYCRLNYFLNFSDSLLTNSIGYADFLNGNFLCVYDLSTCSKSNVGFLVPSIRLGDLKFLVEFNKPLKHKVTMLIYQEHPALISINSNRKVTMSYTRI